MFNSPQQPFSVLAKLAAGTVQQRLDKQLKKAVKKEKEKRLKIFSTY